MSGDMTRSTRRTFLGTLAGMTGAMVFPSRALSFLASRGDTELFLEKIALAKHLSAQPLGVIMAAVGRSFLDTPYVGQTLEEPGPEHLVVNLRGLDCVTFVENTLALSRCVKLHKTGFEDFRNQLTLVRYRSGIINGYPSRLHYFTDWIADNAEKGIVRDMNETLGGKAYRKVINFMSTHTSSYKQLSDTLFVEKIATREKAISSGDLFFLPKDQIAAIEGRLQSGDILGMVTTMEGMDIAHTGMVLVDGGVTRFLHASLSGKKVVLSKGSLAEYVQSVKSYTGIVVARPLQLKIK